MFGVDQIVDLDKQVYGSILNPSGYLNNSDAGYYVPYLNQGRIAQENLDFQRENLRYQQSLQQQLFNREDISIQRRVADLKAAGLSPVLAAGQGAGSGPVVATSAPQRGQYPDLAMILANLIKMDADISATRAQEAYTQIQTQNAGSMLPAQLAQIEAGIKKMDADTYKTYQEAKKAKVEAKNMEDTGTSGNNIFSQWFRDLSGVNQKQIENYQKNIVDKANGKPVKLKDDEVKPFDIVPGLMGPTIKWNPKYKKQ